MSATDPRQAVIDKIAAQPGVAIIAAESASGWQVITVADGPLNATSPSSITFLKERGGETDRLFAVTYTDHEGTEHLDIVGVGQTTDEGWVVTGNCGGSGGDAECETPRLNLGGWWDADHQCAGGRVTGTGADRAHTVQIRVNGSVAMEDVVENGVILFSTAKPVDLMVATVRILDPDGALIAEHTAL